jgi:hypothetical protein
MSAEELPSRRMGLRNDTKDFSVSSSSDHTIDIFLHALEIDTTLPWDIWFSAWSRKCLWSWHRVDSTLVQSNHRRLICPCTQWWIRDGRCTCVHMTNMFQYYQMSICQIFLIDSYTSTSRPWLYVDDNNIVRSYHVILPRLQSVSTWRFRPFLNMVCIGR